MENRSSGYFNYKIVVGVFILLAGVFALINNFGFYTGIDFWDFWPLILIIIGLGKLFQPAEYRNTFGGLVILIVGIFFQLSTLDIIDFGFRQLWPFILILVGIAILKQSFWGGKNSGGIESNTVNFMAMLGGGEYNFNSQNLVGGSATAILGGGTINLANAEMTGDSMVIDVFALMGGVDIIVPKHWSVIVNGLPIMGGISDKTLMAVRQKTSPDAVPAESKKLIIKGIAIMGGVEVKN